MNVDVQPMLFFNIFVLGFRFAITGDATCGYLNDLGVSSARSYTDRKWICSKKTSPCPKILQGILRGLAQRLKHLPAMLETWV